MLISHSHQFLFVHVQRTGGGTVSRILADCVDHPEPNTLTRALRKWPFPRDPQKTSFSAHALASDVRRRWPREVYDRYFKFAFVRNPWSWLVSLHARVGSTPSHRHYARVSNMNLAQYVDFEIGRNRRHQHRFVCASKGELIVDFIGHLETLAEDLKTVCERIGIPTPAELPQIGARSHAPWQEAYDAPTRAAVARHWQRDIELFGYSFDGLRADPVESA